MITNGWGQNWVSHDISWLGSTMTIHDYQGSRQSNGASAIGFEIWEGPVTELSLDGFCLDIQ